MNHRLLVTCVAILAVGVGVVDVRGSQSEFVSKFDVDKAQLAHTGKNPYFIPMEPGYRLVLEGGKTKLTVTVTGKTKRGDGGETRVVEGREEENGQLIEISQNY